jgi:hypothetical protein
MSEHLYTNPSLSRHDLHTDNRSYVLLYVALLVIIRFACWAAPSTLVGRADVG